MAVGRLCLPFGEQGRRLGDEPACRVIGNGRGLWLRRGDYSAWSVTVRASHSEEAQGRWGQQASEFQVNTHLPKAAPRHTSTARIAHRNG